MKSNNGGEYISSHFIKYFEDHGISRQYIVPCTLEHNGVLEQKNPTLLKLLTTTKLPHSFWAKTIVGYIQKYYYTYLVPKKNTI